MIIVLQHGKILWCIIHHASILYHLSLHLIASTQHNDYGVSQSLQQFSHIQSVSKNCISLNWGFNKEQEHHSQHLTNLLTIMLLSFLSCHPCQKIELPQNMPWNHMTFLFRCTLSIPVSLHQEVSMPMESNSGSIHGTLSALPYDVHSQCSKSTLSQSQNNVELG